MDERALLRYRYHGPNGNMPSVGLSSSEMTSYKLSASHWNTYTRETFCKIYRFQVSKFDVKSFWHDLQVSTILLFNIPHWEKCHWERSK